MTASSRGIRRKSPPPARSKSSESIFMPRAVSIAVVAVFVCALSTLAQPARRSPQSEGGPVRRSTQREAGTSALDEMVQTERRFAARALVVGWKQSFIEYFADAAVAFNA